MRVLIATDVFSDTSTNLVLEQENLIWNITDLGEDCLLFCTLYDYDIILLDLMPLDTEGCKILQRLRAARVGTPILILSCLDEIDQKVNFLRLGADDFLTKPFDGRELIARIRAIVRRSKGHSESTIRTGKLVVNLDTRVVSIDGQPVHLTRKEYGILELLSLRKGTILAKELFLGHLYGGMDEPQAKIIDVLVYKLRKKLAQATGGSHYIETVWDRGYVLRDPAAVPAATLVAGSEDLGAFGAKAATKAAGAHAVGQAYQRSPKGAQRLGPLEHHLTNRRDGVRDHPIGRKRASGIGLGTKAPRVSLPVEVRFEDAVTTDGGPLHRSMTETG